MNQEMTDVPEYRQVQNAPSKNSEKESYKKGYNQALNDFEDGIKEHFNNGHVTLACGWLFKQIIYLKEKNND